MISYQGKLMQPSGAPVPNGLYAIQFAIYDSPSGGTALWSETNPSVQIKGGLFATMLGSVVNLPANLFDSPNRFFGIRVGNDSEMMQRQGIASVAFSTRSASAEIADTVKDGVITESKLAPGLSVPIGTVVSWWGDAASVPAGWKLCDGSAISDTESPLNGLVSPNLVSKFIRGVIGNIRPAAPTGGKDTVDLTHVHTVNNHRHIVDNHAHRLATGIWCNLSTANSDQVFTYPDGITRAAKDFGDQSSQSLETNTGGSTPGTSYESPGTSNSLGITSTIPVYVGLIYIMRIK